ncbi:MAG: ferredoxin--NADP reductase [Myxococcota bacterium]
MPTFHSTTIAARRNWDAGLFSLTLNTQVPFAAGQFLTLSRDPDGGRHRRRAYSVASKPDEPLEFLIVEVEGGAVSPLLSDLQPGDAIHVSDAGKGFFVPADVPSAPDLWLMATGTGVAPYRAMLREASLFDRFERIILVYGARTKAQHAYAQEFDALAQANAGRFQWIGLTSQEQATASTLHGRMTTRLIDGQLEARAKRPIDPRHSQVMLCGNPSMISEMLDGLERRGLSRNSRRHPGQVTIEKYW